MRIAQIVPSLESRHGGPSVSVPGLAAGLARNGEDVGLLTTGPTISAARQLEPRLTAQVFLRGRPERICPSAGLAAHLRKLETDILHSHGLWLRPLHYAHQRARTSDARLVISPRGMMAPWAWEHHRWQKALAGRLIHPGAFHAARGWHATSQAEADDIRALGFRQPVCVAPNGVAEPTSEERARATEYWQAACPEAFHRPTALFYSRLHPKKRVLQLIDLWLAQAPADWLLLLVGIPEAYTVEQLRDYVHRGSGSGRVQVEDGTDAPAPYVAASLLLLPSHSENFGLVVAESLAHGLPVVVTDTTPWQAVQAAGRGWCVPWEQFPAAMSEALAEGPDGLHRRGARARPWVLAEYSWEKSARQLADFYLQLRRA
jgi:glycosyltransferase involved in cell wall biosynthesis